MSMWKRLSDRRLVRCGRTWEMILVGWNLGSWVVGIWPWCGPTLDSFHLHARSTTSTTLRFYETTMYDYFQEAFTQLRSIRPQNHQCPLKTPCHPQSQPTKKQACRKATTFHIVIPAEVLRDDGLSRMALIVGVEGRVEIPASDIFGWQA